MTREGRGWQVGNKHDDIDSLYAFGSLLQTKCMGLVVAAAPGQPFLTAATFLSSSSHLTSSSVSAAERGMLKKSGYLKLVLALRPFCEITAASYAMPASSAVLKVPNHLWQEAKEGRM